MKHLFTNVFTAICGVSCLIVIVLYYDLHVRFKAQKEDFEARFEFQRAVAYEARIFIRDKAEEVKGLFFPEVSAYDVINATRRIDYMKAAWDKKYKYNLIYEVNTAWE